MTIGTHIVASGDAGSVGTLTPPSEHTSVWVEGSGGSATVTHPGGHVETISNGESPLVVNHQYGVPLAVAITAGTSITVKASDPNFS